MHFLPPTFPRWWSLALKSKETVKILHFQIIAGALQAWICVVFIIFIVFIAFPKVAPQFMPHFNVFKCIGIVGQCGFIYEMSKMQMSQSIAFKMCIPIECHFDTCTKHQWPKPHMADVWAWILWSTHRTSVDNAWTFRRKKRAREMHARESIHLVFAPNFRVKLHGPLGKYAVKRCVRSIDRRLASFERIIWLHN